LIRAGVAGAAEKTCWSRRVAEAGNNDLVCRLAFGSLTLQESLRAIKLYAGAVMPALGAVRQATE